MVRLSSQKPDILWRLREMPSSLNDALRTMEEAAEEIKRLRRERDHYKEIADRNEATNV